MGIINIDMDNVVADFERHYFEITGTSWESESEPIKRWEKLAGKEKSFFLLMPAFEGTIEFVDEVKRLAQAAGHQCQFLTALPSIWKFYSAEEEKSQWVSKNIGPEFPVVIGPYAKDKAGHCKPNDILIDDSPLNIEQWERAGGFGILHTSFF